MKGDQVPDKRAVKKRLSEVRALMISFDFVPYPGWDTLYIEHEIISGDEASLFDNAMPSKFVSNVNGIDLSWNMKIPMLEYARKWFGAVMDLKDKNSSFLFSLDFEDMTRLSKLANNDVEIRPGYTNAVGICALADLRPAVTKFALRVYDLFMAAYPLILKNDSFSEWYCLEEMRAETSSE